MAEDKEEEEEAVVVGGNLMKLLAVAVRSVQWSYAIFWSMSTSEQGVLVWGEGYYNGDIKTTKTSQAAEAVKADKMGLRRSKQLRELYESLSHGENSEEEEQEEATMACGTSLSPEDLSNTEWFYMVCMSFEFQPGEGLPGRALANEQTIWLCDTQYADRKVFLRSLLAKSGSVQTVLCFPYLGGVVELGTIELVAEDPALIQHVKTTLLDFSKPDCYAKFTRASYSTENDEDPTCVKVGKDNRKMIKNLQNACSAAEDISIEDEEMSIKGPSNNSEDDLGIGLPDDSSFTSGRTQQSQVHSWSFTNGGFSIDVPGSMNSSDCVSQVLERSADKISKPKFGPVNASQHYKSSDDLHYIRVISTILKRSDPLIRSLGCSSCVRRSSFGTWKNIGDVTNHGTLETQKILKKMLFAVPLMYSRQFVKPKMEHAEETVVSKAWDDTLQKLEKNKFLTLKSMVPWAGLDKASVLNNAIKYMQELEARLEELESTIQNTAEPKQETSKVQTDAMVRKKAENSDKKTLGLKRKACESEVNKLLKLQITEKEVLIEISCSWREYLLLDIMDALNRLQLDAHSVQSSTLDGMLTLKVTSKFRGTAAVVSAPELKLAIWESIYQ